MQADVYRRDDLRITAISVHDPRLCDRSSYTAHRNLTGAVTEVLAIGILGL